MLVDAKTLAEYSSDQTLGSRVAGRFAVVGVLGQGGFGAVYRAIQQPVGRPVALKLIRPEVKQREQVQARFFREAKVVAGLNDPHVVTLYDYGEAEDGALFMAFEFVHGDPLDVVITEQGPLAPVRVAHLLLQVLRALAVAHRRGLIHRDIKPANIMVRRDEFDNETVKVLDFGIAKVAEAAEGKAATVETREGMVLGTPRYMSPEQARSQPIDARCDLYSVGVMAYEMLAGQAPFLQDSAIEVLMDHIMKPPPPFTPDLELPPALSKVVMRALGKKPEDRFQSAIQMAEALAACFEGLSLGSSMYEVSQLSGVPAPRVDSAIGGTSREMAGALSELVTDGVSEELDVALPRRRGPLIAGVLLLLLVGGGVALLMRPQPPERPDESPVVNTIDVAKSVDARVDASVPADATVDAAIVDAVIDAQIDVAVKPAKPKQVKRRRRLKKTKPKPKKAPAASPNKLTVPEF